MLLLLSTAFALPGDTLAGVTVGAPFVRADYDCGTPSICQRPGSIAGQSGQITVSLCGDRVEQVSFQFTFVPQEIFLALTEEHRVAGGIRLWSEPMIRLSTQALEDGLRTAGWRKTSEDATNPKSIYKVFANDQGFQRLYAVDHKAVSAGDLTFKTVGVTLQTYTTGSKCTDGL